MQVTVAETAPKKGITFDKINRRTHLYAALFFLPWFFAYGASSAIFNHPKWLDTGPLEWKPLFERAYDAGPLPSYPDLRATAARILADNSLNGQFVVRWNSEGNLQIDQNRFLWNVQLIYRPGSRRLTARRAVPRWPNLLTRLHARGGFETPGVLEHAWAVIVDIVQFAMLVWIGSGLYMWWHLKRLRSWGWLALGSGVALFVAFLAGL